MPPGKLSSDLARLAGKLGTTHEYDARVLHRYDGDRTLSPGRYSTLCSADADDGGTLTQEMKEYMNPSKSGAHVEVFDGSIAQHKQRIAELGLSPDSGERVVIRYLPFGQAPGAQGPKSVLLSIETIIRDVVIPGVLDLRRPEAANWLTRTISRLELRLPGGAQTLPCFNRPPLDDFVQIMPSLYDQVRGGGNFHIIVGLYLRCLGVSGLAFPSVRSDAFVEFANGEPTNSGGWSFVDFRDTEAPKIIGFYEQRPNWPEILVLEGGDDNIPHPAAYGDEVTFRASGLTEGTGVMSVTGVRQRLEATYLAESARAAIQTWLPDIQADELQSFLLLLSILRARDAQTLSKMVLWSLLGVPEAQTDLRAALENQLKGRPESALLAKCHQPSYWQTALDDNVSRFLNAVISSKKESSGKPP